MPTVNLPGTDSPATTSYVSPGGSFYIYSNMTMPNGRAMANGLRHILVTAFGLYVAGRSGSVSLRPWFAGSARGSYTSYAAQGTPSRKSMAVGVYAQGGGTFGYGVYWGGGSVNFRRGGGGSTQSSGSSSWGSSLSGIMSYAEAPEAPTPVGVIGQTPTSLTVQFNGNDNGGAAITGWSLQYSKSSNFSSGVTTISSSGTTTVTGLTPNTTYYFRAAGRNAITDHYSTTGPFSTTFSGKTLVSTPGAPGSFAVTALSSTQVKATWKAPTNNGGSAVTGYRLQYSKSSTFASGVTSVNLGNVLTWTSGTLDVGTWYFRVQAINANGNGSWSSTKSNTVTRTGYPTVILEESEVQKPLKVYLGGAWVTKPVKSYKDGKWVVLL